MSVHMLWEEEVALSFTVCLLSVVHTAIIANWSYSRDVIRFFHFFFHIRVQVLKQEDALSVLSLLHKVPSLHLMDFAEFSHSDPNLEL